MTNYPRKKIKHAIRLETAHIFWWIVNAYLFVVITTIYKCSFRQLNSLIKPMHHSFHKISQSYVWIWVPKRETEKVLDGIAVFLNYYL